MVYGLGRRVNLLFDCEWQIEAEGTEEPIGMNELKRRQSNRKMRKENLQRERCATKGAVANTLCVCVCCDGWIA